MRRLFAVGCGGFVGAMTRYGVTLAVSRFWTRDLPLATFLINVTGSFVLGFFSTWAADRTTLDPAIRLLVGTGFVGAYTTFSTFEYETERLTESGAGGWALANVVGSVTAGFLAVRLGVRVAR